MTLIKLGRHFRMPGALKLNENPGSPTLDAFQARCHEIVTCFGFAASGLTYVANNFRPKLNGNPDQKLFMVTGHPDEGKTHAEMCMADVVLFASKDGEFSDMLAKSLLVTMYAEWDELYRHRLANEIGIEASRLKSDLMGDLRILRHWIVHSKSIADKKNLRTINLSIKEGDKLKITLEMFNQLIDQVNVMTVRIED